MELRGLLRFLILFLGFSHVFSSLTVPQSELLKSGFEDPSLKQFLEQASKDEKNYGDGLEFNEAIRGRMDIETDDYPGTGANNDHNPKTPGNR